MLDTLKELARRLLGRPAPTEAVNLRPVQVFFAPEAGVSLHFITNCVAARTLAERGHDVLIVRCNQAYRHCVVMDMLNYPVDKTGEQRATACNFCRGNHERMTGAYGLPSIGIEELVDQATLDRIATLVADMPANAGELDVEGFRFGALCSSDIALNTKALDQMTATGVVRQRLEQYVFGALLSFYATKRLIASRPVARLTFFNEYGMLAGAALAAQQAGVPVTRLTVANHKDVDRSRIVMLHRPLGTMSSHEALDNWDRWRDLPLTPAKVADVGENFRARITGTGITLFSTGFAGRGAALREQLGLSPDRQVLVAYTSSLDELNANRNLMSAFGVDLFQKEQPFADQIAWLTALIGHVEASANLQLIVRVHPREAPNERGENQSAHLAKLEAAFGSKYRYVRMIWPHEKISSYDLADIAAVALPAWSNISLELAAMGVPVMVAFQRYVPFPVPDVVDWAADRDAYFRVLDEITRRPPSFDRMRRLYRWANRYSLAIAAHLDDLYPNSNDYTALPEWVSPQAARTIERVFVGGESIVDINRAELASATDATPAAEAVALLAEIEQMFAALGGNAADNGGALSPNLARLQALIALGRLEPA